MNFKRIIVTALTIICCMAVFPQKMSVEKMEVLSMDTYASVHKRVDNNGMACAAVRVSLPIAGVTFSGTNHIGGIDRLGAEYILFIPSGSKKMYIQHPNFHELEVVFGEYGIERLQSVATYRITINASSQPSQTLSTAQRSIDETVLPNWFFTQKDLWYGISLPCSNPVQAKKHALVNAFLMYLFNSGNGKLQGTESYSLHQEENHKEMSTQIVTRSTFKSVERAAIENIVCNVDREFYNYRGEYIVECNFGQAKSGSGKCSIIRSVNYDNDTDEGLTSYVTIEANIEDYEIAITAKYEKQTGYTIEIDGSSMINNRTLAYDDFSWLSDGKKAENALSYDISTSCGAAMTQLLTSLPWLPCSYSCSSSCSDSFECREKSNLIEEYNSTFNGAYISKVDTLLKPLALDMKGIAGNKLYFTINSSTLSAKSRSKSGYALFEAYPMMVANHAMANPSGQESYLRLHANVWRHLIANSLAYDKIRILPANNKASSKMTTSMSDDLMSSSLQATTRTVNSYSENFDVSYDLFPSGSSQMLNIQVGTKIAGNVLRKKDGKTNLKIEKANSKNLAKQGWNLLSGPNGLTIEQIMSQIVLFGMEVNGEDGNPPYCFSTGSGISRDLCDAILISCHEADLDYVQKNFTSISIDGGVEKIESGNVLSPPLWSYSVFHTLPDGKIEVSITNVNVVEAPQK